MIKLVTILLTILLLETTMFANTWSSPEIAINKAKQSHKPIILFVSKDGCEACKDIAQRFLEPHYAVALSNFELAIIDVDVAEKQYNYVVERTPTFLFLNSEKNELAPKIEGSPADDYEFITYMSKVTIVAEKEAQDETATKDK